MFGFLKRRPRLALCVLLLGSAFLSRHAISNLYHMAQEPAYFIPEESSIFGFRPIQMNGGSGDWWLVGEDGSAFYVLSNAPPWGYHLIEKQCFGRDGFDPSDRASWGYCVSFKSLPNNS